MRVYLPVTMNLLAAALAPGATRELSGGSGFAVTPGMREWYASGDTEELEYIALSLAAAASLALISGDPAAPRRRVVIAADVDPAAVSGADDGTRASRGQITVTQPIAFARVAAVHVDDAGAAAAVEAAALDPSDEFATEEAADHELLWYATQEVEDLLRGL
ncbi:MAG TPA: hypothetical protein VHX15_18495 [Frankiaceae bacterium]|jgi:hypothetical protein|nr:hypothetical protein [Frankiaceae bacterium]